MTTWNSRSIPVRTNFAKLVYFLRSSTTPTLDNPNPINIHWSKSADISFLDSVLKVSVLEMNVVTKHFELAHILNHHRLPTLG
jgi:hypothetical protein